MDTEIPGSKDGFGAKSSFLVADSAGWVGCGVLWCGLVRFGLTQSILISISKDLCPASKNRCTKQ